MTEARANEIGRARCPTCDSNKASLRVSAKQLAYITCNTCNCQVFSRSDRSDELLRKRLEAEAAPEPAAPPSPTHAPTPHPAPAPKPSPAPAADAWGYLAWAKQ